MVRTIGALLIATILLQPVAALAVAMPRRVVHYTHQRWSAESAAPGPIFIMAQGRDGYLWFTAGDGLFRFDGVRFEQIRTAVPIRRLGSPVALLVARNGDVWTNFSRTGQFGIYRNGALRLIPSPEYRPGDQMLWMVETADGAIWSLVGDVDRGPLRYHHGRWRRFGARDGLPRDDAPTAMLVARDGALWVSYNQSVMRLAPGAARFERARATPGAEGRISQDPAGRIWLSGNFGSYPVSGPGGRGQAPSVRFPYPTVRSTIGRPMFDRAGNLWIAVQFGGVLRIAQPNPNGAASAADAAAAVETFRKSDGLTSDITTNAFEDRESNIWIGTEIGLDKLRPASVRVEPALTSPPDLGDVLLGASDGTVYIAEARTVYRVRPGGSPEVILADMPAPEDMCEAPDGAIWMAFEGRVLAWKDGKVRPIPGKPPTDNGFTACAFDRRGDFWATANASGMFRYRDGRWQSMFGPVSDRDRFYPSLMVRDARGGLFLKWSRSAMSWLDYPRRRSIAIAGERAQRTLRTLYPTRQGDVLAVDTAGFFRYRDGRVRTLSFRQVPQLEAVDGIVQTPDGYTWTTTQETIARMRTRDLDRAFADPAFTPPALTLGMDDGLPNRVYSGPAGRGMVRGGDGRLWLGTLAGIVWLDPNEILRNSLPPPVAIASLKVGETLYNDPKAVRLRPAPASIEIDYAALSFVNPKKVAFRYRLEGYDADWIDPGMRRQAFYTNLAPGKYRFRVIAANSEGVWNRTGATLDFEIPPTFLQSRWFFALCIALGLAALWLLYRLRLAQVAQGIRNRLEERLSERERIARELHDTLLQSVQGLVLRFQSVANRMPPAELARTQLEAALQRADDIIIDGRNRVRDLRPAGRDRDRDLQDMVQELAGSAGFDPPIPIRIVVEGRPRPVDPLVADEIRRIASEALFNVARHARAGAVDVTIGFAPQALAFQIRDDGVGIPEEVVARGHKPDHFGLVGMRERAERIGGTLSIASEAGKGCEVTLTLPARLAFTAQRERGWRFPRLFRLGRGSTDV